MARYITHNGRVYRFPDEEDIERVQPDPTLLIGAFQPSGSPAPVKPFGSPEEMIEAMSDVRYRSDERYRQEVIGRIGVTESTGARVTDVTSRTHTGRAR